MQVSPSQAAPPQAAPPQGAPSPHVAGHAGATPRFYDTADYSAEAKAVKSGEAGDFWDKWPGSTDGSPSQFHFRIGPSLTPDGKVVRQVLKFFVPKNFNDPQSEKDVFLWPEGSEQTTGRQNPILEAISRLKQVGVSEELLSDIDPVDCAYVQGWFRDDTGVNVTRIKPQWINLKKSQYNQLVQAIGNQRKIYGDLFNPVNGWDWLITRSGSGRYNTKYTLSVVPCSWLGSSGPVHPDQNVARQMLDAMKPLTEQFPTPTPDQIGAMEEAARRIEDHFRRMSATSYIHGSSFPSTNAGVPQMANGQFPSAAPPQGGQPGYPPQQQQPQSQQQPGYPPQQPQQPGYPPQGGQPGYPPQGGQPGYPPQQMGATRPFDEGTPDAAGQVVPTTSGGQTSVQAGSVLRYDLDGARMLVQNWGLHSEWVESVSEDGYWCRVVVPAAAQLGYEGEWFVSLIEDCGKRGEFAGKQKFWKTDSLRGLKRHINSLLQKRGVAVVESPEESAPATPVAEPPLPNLQSTPPAPVPAQPAQPEQPVDINQPPGPYPGTSVESTGGRPPACYFNPNQPSSTGYYVVSAANPMQCLTCPWEERCKGASDQYRSQVQG